MADLNACTEKCSRDIGSDLGSIDPILERILWHLEDDSKKNVIDELTDDFDLEELLEARETMFLALTNKGDARADNGGHQDESDGLNPLGPRLSRAIAVPWQLIKRRSTTLAADDVCELYMYYCDNDKGFPTKMLKRQALKADASVNETLSKKRSPNPAQDDVCELFVYHLDKDKDFPTKIPKKQGTENPPTESETSRKYLDTIPEQVEDSVTPARSQAPIHAANMSMDAQTSQIDITDELMKCLLDSSDATTEVSLDTSDHIAAIPNSPSDIGGETQSDVNLETHRNIYMNKPSTPRNLSVMPDQVTSVGVSFWSLNDMGSVSSLSSEGIGGHNESGPMTKDSAGQTDTTQETDNISHTSALSTQISLLPTPGQNSLVGNSIWSLNEVDSVTPLPPEDVGSYEDSQNNRTFSIPEGHNMYSSNQSAVEVSETCVEQMNLPNHMQNPHAMQMPTPQGVQNAVSEQCSLNMEADKQVPPSQPTGTSTIQSDGSSCRIETVETIPRPVTDHTLSGQQPERPTPTQRVNQVTNRNQCIILSVDKATTTTSDMATQTGPKEIADPSIKQWEFTSQMEYVEGTLTNHERRLRTSEVWREKQSRKVDKIDADFYTLYTDLHASHENLRTSHENLLASHENLTEGFLCLRKVVEDLILVTPNYENLIAKPNPSIAQTDLAEAIRRCRVNDSSEDRSRADRQTHPAIEKWVGPVDRLMPAKTPPVPPETTDAAPAQARAPAPLAQVNILPVEILPSKPQAPVTAPPTPNMDTVTKPQEQPHCADAPKVVRKEPQHTKSKTGGGAIPKGQTKGAEKYPEVPIEKKSENPADSFLKEARRVIPNARGRRNSRRQNQIRPGPQPTNQSTRQPEIAATTNPYTFLAENMYAPLEIQNVGTPPRRGPGNQKRQNEIPPFLPDESPPRRDDPGPNPQHGPQQKPNRFSASTPIPALNAMDQTWADIDNEDSKAIEAFLANSTDSQHDPIPTPPQPTNNLGIVDNAPRQNPRNAAIAQADKIVLDGVNSAGTGRAKRDNIGSGAPSQPVPHVSQSRGPGTRPTQPGGGGRCPT